MQSGLRHRITVMSLEFWKKLASFDFLNFEENMRSTCILLFALFLFFMSCEQKPKEQTATENTTTELDIQGHRGARGLLPENTIPGFKKALELGVTTLEMDVVITKDRQVVLSHEPFFNHTICLDSAGDSITEESERLHNIYELTYEEVLKYDCGSIGNPRFVKQEKMVVYKPLLKEVIETAEAYAKELGRPAPLYNIELKSSPENDSVFHPVPNEFSDIVYGVIDSLIPWERVVIQCFDFRVLQYFYRKYPDVQLAALVENEKSIDENLQHLGFLPEIYSPYYMLLTSEKIEFLHETGVKVIPWTINDLETMQKLIGWGVDGIITDYPDIAQELL